MRQPLGGAMGGGNTALQGPRLVMRDTVHLFDPGARHHHVLATEGTSTTSQGTNQADSPPSERDPSDSGRHPKRHRQDTCMVLRLEVCNLMLATHSCRVDQQSHCLSTWIRLSTPTHLVEDHWRMLSLLDCTEGQGHITGVVGSSIFLVLGSQRRPVSTWCLCTASAGAHS